MGALIHAKLFRIGGFLLVFVSRHDYAIAKMLDEARQKHPFSRHEPGGAYAEYELGRRVECLDVERAVM